MPLDTVRDLLREKTEQNLIKQRFQQAEAKELRDKGLVSDSDLRRTFFNARTDYKELEHEKTEIYKNNYKQTVDTFEQRDIRKDEPFEFYTQLDFDTLPENRIPTNGINILPLRYHTTNPVVASEQLPETGHKKHPLIRYLLIQKYPKYREILKQYCRPLGTTDATFADFNKEQTHHDPPTKEKMEQTLELVMHYLDARPIRPMHFCDTRFTKTPANTGTGYYNRHHYSSRAHARYARPDDYKCLPTSKGYFMNTTLVIARAIIHNIKYNGCLRPDLDEEEIISRTREFFQEHATLLFTRNHISKIHDVLKQRPVYCVDDVFILIEQMLTFPILVAARRMTCCILYGLETMRGGMAYIDNVAKNFKSFATFDYSGFDQRAPRCITDIYYQHFLPRLLIINKGYQPTYEYATTPGATPDKLGLAMHNLLKFLHTWYNNMVFITQDGYAYTRTTAGVPSGLLNTQYIDSFINIYMMLDAMLEFGYSPDEITSNFEFHIMGDDNTIMSRYHINELERFRDFYATYVNERFGAVVNATKSNLTSMRHKIEILGYQCNFGRPKRNIQKLIAQLCFPEHGTVDKYMSYRALGMVYASAGEDTEFFEFCKDVYYTFYPYKADLTTEVQEVLSKHVLRIFSITDSFLDVLKTDEFPTIEEIRSRFKEWQGPLDFAPKWDFLHFIDEPDPTLNNIKTLYEYRTENNLHYEGTVDYFPTE